MDEQNANSLLNIQIKQQEYHKEMATPAFKNRQSTGETDEIIKFEP